MKRILGLDLGSTSIGWAYVLEGEKPNEQSQLLDGGVRVNPLTTDEKKNFADGRPITTNADRTLHRSARRNLQRFKLRRGELKDQLIKAGFIDAGTPLIEEGKDSTYSTMALRAKAAEEKISRKEFARVLLMINKKRGYKSSRKVKNDEDGVAIDDMKLAKLLVEKNMTPGQYVISLINKGKWSIPTFYMSDLQQEFDTIYQYQARVYPEVLTQEFYQSLQGKGQKSSTIEFRKQHGIDTAQIKGNRAEKIKQAYEWRADAVDTELNIAEVAFVLCEINKNIASSSGYLAAISDRSKELFFQSLTVGQYQYQQILSNRHLSQKNQVFYRQDYMDEFDRIWKQQKSYRGNKKRWGKKNKRLIRDAIFFQRRLKSQKHLVSNCQFESQRKAVPRSSPLFQEFRIWQTLQNLQLLDKVTKQKYYLDEEAKQELRAYLGYRAILKKSEVLKLLGRSSRGWDLNYDEVKGDTTQSALYAAFEQMIEEEGTEVEFKKMTPPEILEVTAGVLRSLGVDTSILTFDSDKKGNEFDKQPYFQLWHLLYSYEGDDSKSGNESLIRSLMHRFGFPERYARLLVNVSLEPDYGSVSARAIKKILPHLRNLQYDQACALAGYNHSSSITAEENLSRELRSKLELLPKNALRNPVVEKIVNQLINLVNAIIEDPNLGRPDEIRIELARELKKNAKEREDATKAINANTKRNDAIRKILNAEFGILNPTRKDIIRYRLYEELKSNGYKSLYTNTYISRDQLFTKQVEIEHIIPQSRVFDDSFSNKTLSTHAENQDKANETAHDYIVAQGPSALEEYRDRVTALYQSKEISMSKYRKLLMPGDQINEGFIERDLRQSQYIAVKAKSILLEITRVVTSTTGSVTNRLRNDWDLINVLKELTIDKYRAAGMTKVLTLRDGRTKEVLIDWTKRNDHRHHAMDALVVAFTRPAYIQYLNNLNARSNQGSAISGIQNKWTYRDHDGKRRFISPMINMRAASKVFLQSILISHKAKNKVVTRNLNKSKKKGGYNRKMQLTPRGQLHKETVYGTRLTYNTQEVKIGAKFDIKTIERVAVKAYREALFKRLEEFDGNAKKAFGGANSPSKRPIYINGDINRPLPERVKLVSQDKEYTKRVSINPDLKEKQIEKIVDVGVQRIIKSRLAAHGGDPKKAFVNLDEDPIWLNKEKGIFIKKVTMRGVSNAIPLRNRRDHLGELIHDDLGHPIPSDYVSTGNNHHVAIYRDHKGKLQEKVVSFMEAVTRVNMGIPVVDRVYKADEGWEFLFSMKQNEMFIFPGDDFDPMEINVFEKGNNISISKHLFRVQKIATKNYVFSHHLETEAISRDTLKNEKNLAGLKYHSVRTTDNLKGILKVRLNVKGEIVQSGEYM